MDLDFASCREAKDKCASQVSIAPSLLLCFDDSLADVQGLAFHGSTFFMISVSLRGSVFVGEFDVVHIPASFALYLFDGVVTNSSFRGSVAVIY